MATTYNERYLSVLVVGSWEYSHVVRARVHWILDAARRHSAGQESRSIPCAISLIRRYWAARPDPTTNSLATLPTSTESMSPRQATRY